MTHEELDLIKTKIDKFCEDLKRKLPYIKITQVVEKGKVTTLKIEGTILISELK